MWSVYFWERKFPYSELPPTSNLYFVLETSVCAVAMILAAIGWLRGRSWSWHLSVIAVAYVTIRIAAGGILMSYLTVHEPGLSKWIVLSALQIVAPFVLLAIALRAFHDPQVRSRFRTDRFGISGRVLPPALVAIANTVVNWNGT